MNFTNEQLDVIAEQMYDYACANRKDNLNKDGSAGDPRKVGAKYELLWESPKNFYRNMARWHLENMPVPYGWKPASA